MCTLKNNHVESVQGDLAKMPVAVPRVEILVLSLRGGIFTVEDKANIGPARGKELQARIRVVK